jgi:hypothetical protein
MGPTAGCEVPHWATNLSSVHPTRDLITTSTELFEINTTRYSITFKALQVDWDLGKTRRDLTSFKPRTYVTLVKQTP